MALTLGDNFSYQGAKPLDARLKYATLAEMSAVADATMYDGCMAYCVATDKTYQWKSTNTVDADTGKWREFSSGSAGTTDYTDLENKPSINNVTLSGNKTTSDLGLQDTIQYSSMPTASEDLEGAVYQYLGSTTSTYTHGHWYECVSDGEDPATYSWVEAPNYEEMDDSDMDDVVTPLPSVSARYHKYSTEEQVVGEWIDGSTLYQRTIVTTMPEVTLDKTDAKNNTSIGASIDYAQLISCERYNNTTNIPISQYFYNTEYGVFVYIKGNNDTSNANTVELHSNCEGWSGQTVYITIQYTKASS